MIALSSSNLRLWFGILLKNRASLVNDTKTSRWGRKELFENLENNKVLNSHMKVKINLKAKTRRVMVSFYRRQLRLSKTWDWEDKIQFHQGWSNLISNLPQEISEVTSKMKDFKFSKVEDLVQEVAYQVQNRRIWVQSSALLRHNLKTCLVINRTIPLKFL